MSFSHVTFTISVDGGVEAATGADDVPGIGIYLGIVLESRNLVFRLQDCITFCIVFLVIVFAWQLILVWHIRFLLQRKMS